MAKILYIVNRAALGGTGARAWERFRSLWPYQVAAENILITAGPGHAREIATTCKGYEIIAAVGGDGTASEILSGIMDREGPRPVLAVIPAGTGNDIAHNVGILSIEDAVAALRQGHTQLFDLIRIDCQYDGQPSHRYAILSCWVGFAVVSANLLKPWMKRLLGATGAYYLSTFLGLILHRPPQMTVRCQNQEYSARSWVVLVANAEWMAGGSMRVGPGARMDDGELNVTIVPPWSKAKALLKMPKLANGSHVNEPDIQYFTAKKIEVDCVQPAILEMDGDTFGTTPATFTVCPSAVRIVSAKLPGPA